MVTPPRRSEREQWRIADIRYLYRNESGGLLRPGGRGRTHEQAAGRIKRNIQDLIQVIILGRLAVDRRFQGKRIGTGLLKDAVLRTLQAANIAGIRALLVHAISDPAKVFYEAYGFIASPVDPMTLMITLVEA